MRAAINQELLDWLAVEFMDSGWQVKSCIATIVLSSAYQRSSVVTPELLSGDPDNRLIARGPRFRVDAEIVRDVALAASGLLNPQIGGPSVLSAGAVLPETTPPASYSKKTWNSAGRGPTAIAAHSTLSVSAPCPIRPCRPSTHPMENPPACAI